ncbi:MULTISPECIES: DUF317 domain-containing protein [Streptomyces]|uniref:DUF317 domain-containing protein n=1 Tax=Streptomyces coelicolor (strain ATCC BAA-471 / A3(2) / M145) TaxID=100226 RepID=Q9L1R2_STRCO|nr:MULTISPECIES: DUF317 domain-containing protein [Streptomyces]MDX2929226.1 DUF317 domain-containing protein [Streptomyces sp. NRRL_B-16638]MDX3411897.1 DUF317 domain-containing protein [Streptomyces sp. ME02-6977A]MYU46357.1 DUF317 domain-containing protein [Streptomyces sp. SID7813]NSL84617.1 DUF317 domain-containing protein [Streptomyces coelicolor]QFI46632.1 DUF317 domain-containing protein [Streptomyces coelicolor A3(2)]
MPLNERQLDAFADEHAGQIPFDASPRHLAGPGDARHVTHGLAAAGWATISDPLSAEIVMASPDHRYRLQYDPQSATSAWWRLRATSADNEHGWYAEFGELVPAEVLSSLTDALIAPASPQSDPWQPVTSAGWRPDEAGAAHSPDAMCHIERRPTSEFHERPSWHIEVRDAHDTQYPGPRIWHAYLDEHAPDHLVGAFLSALTDQSPLQRGMFDRTAHYSAVKEPSPLRPQQVVDAHTSRVKVLRAQARAMRRQQTAPAKPPAPTTAVQPAARR